MPSLKAIRKRISSVRNTQKITRAMKLVSAAKLRRAQNAMMELRPYAAKVTAPTLVMVGSEDCLTPIDAGPDGAGARWIHENIKGSEFYIVEGSGHTNLMEQPELSADVVIRWFKGESVGNA